MIVLLNSVNFFPLQELHAGREIPKEIVTMEYILKGKNLIRKETQSNITTLHCNFLSISDLAGIENLDLVGCHILNLNKNKINTIYRLTQCSSPTLSAINISKNNIKSITLQDLEKLAQAFPQLQLLTLTENPLEKKSRSAIRIFRRKNKYRIEYKSTEDALGYDMFNSSDESAPEQSFDIFDIPSLLGESDSEADQTLSEADRAAVPVSHAHFYASDNPEFVEPGTESFSSEPIGMPHPEAAFLDMHDPIPPASASNHASHTAANGHRIGWVQFGADTFASIESHSQTNGHSSNGHTPLPYNDL